MSGFRVGEQLVFRTVPKLPGKRPPWVPGDKVRVVKVSDTGALVVSGHGGYVQPRHFERHSGERP